MKCIFQLNISQNGIFSQKYVTYEEDFLVQLCHSYRYLHLIPGHYIRLYPSSLAFKFFDVLALYLLRNFNVLDFHWTVLDMFSVNHLLIVFI